ncbi:HNH endonuclease [Vibrio harveyi]|uniref:HNH endonuclease n=1 Tax=Vibrio harveyi TaxID=669 RepID=UPI002380B42A|nr:HNH endonuclease [Vibrio harveyi]
MDSDDIEKKKVATSSGGGYKPLLNEEFNPKTQTLGETLKELAERQRLARKAELTYTKEDEARWSKNRERVISDRQKVEVPSFDLGEALANPELDAIKPVKLDPASMLADDIESLTEEGKNFIQNPTLLGAASMAAIAIPGKFADDLTSFVGKYKGKNITLDDMKMLDISYLKRSRDELNKLRKEFNNGVRKNFLIELSKDSEVTKKLKALNVPQEEINKLSFGRVPASFEVHHKLPLDDSGTNDFSNLVLIRKAPEHAALTTYQKQTTKNLTVGSVVEVQWPVPDGTIYPKK